VTGKALIIILPYGHKVVLKESKVIAIIGVSKLGLLTVLSMAHATVNLQ